MRGLSQFSLSKKVVSSKTSKITTSGNADTIEWQSVLRVENGICLKNSVFIPLCLGYMRVNALSAGEIGVRLKHDLFNESADHLTIATS